MWKVGRCLLSDHLTRTGLTQQQLADRANMKASQISDYVNNRKTMNLKNAYTLSRILRCRMDELYEWIRL